MLTHGNVIWNMVNFLTCADFRGAGAAAAGAAAVGVLAGGVVLRRREDTSPTCLVRRDGALVHPVGGSDTPEAALRRAAGTLAPRPPRHILPLER
jgi:hypothetical protein